MTRKTPFASKLIIIFLSCLLVFTGVLAFLWSFLSEYEKTNPKECINKYVELIKSSDFKSAMELSGIAESKFFKVSEYEKYIKKTLGNFEKLNIYETVSTKPEERHFQLKGDSDKPINFVLTHSDKKLKYGFKSYKLKQENITMFSYKINLPKGNTPVVNSIVLDESNIINDKGVVTSYNSLNDKKLVPTIVTYQVNGLVFEPEISLKEIDKSKYICRFSKDRSANVTLVPDSSKIQNYEKVATDTAMAYAKYISKDIEFDALKGYVYENTSFYKSIKAYSNVWSVEHNAPVFENFTVKNTCEYSINHFQTEVSFNYVITKGKLKRVYPTKYILSFIKVGDKFMLANLESL